MNPKKPSIPAAAILAKLESSMAEISDFHRVTEGEESQAYRFRRGTETCIVRLNMLVEGFEKDALAYRKFAGADLPIPQILHIGRMDEGPFYCISENLPGVTLQDLPVADLLPVLGPTARILDKMAQADVEDLSDGFGSFNARGEAPFASWHDFLSSVFDPDRYDWAGLPPLPDRAVLQPIFERLDRLIEPCPETRGLVHGDFGSNNVLTDGHRITGVLDWAEAMTGDPLYDVANIFFWRSWLECMEQQARFFETQLRINETSGRRDRLLCYQLRIGIEQLYRFALDGDEGGAAWALTRCRELIL